MLSRFPSTLLILAVIASPCRAAGPAIHPTLTTVAEISGLRDVSANYHCSLSLTGILTLVDASRNMIVLQDATGAVALYPDSSATLELAVGGHRVLVRVASWRGGLPTLHPRLCARFRGVREGVRDANDHLMTGLISAPSELDVSFFDQPGESPRESPLLLEDPVVAGPGGYFFTRGVVTFNDLVRGKKCLFIQDARNGIFVSQAERQLRSILQVGKVIQIGGPLLPGKYAPGILPAGYRIVGWQNLPVPAIPSAEAPEASYRDGQWTEFEGVARAVNADGTLLLMGRKVSIPVWVGQTDRDGLEQLVNCTLMITLDGEVIKMTAPNFFEAAWVNKYKGVYYFSYSTTPKAQMRFDYMTSDKPTGGFTYRGIVSDQPPINSNNHHAAQFEFKDRWYHVYHNRIVAKEAGIPTGFRRNLALEEFGYAPNGDIKKVEFTTGGVKQQGGLDPFARVEGETFQSQKGVETIPCDEGGLCLTELEKGDWVKLVGVDFGSRGVKKFSARVASENAGGKIEVRLDGPEGRLLGTCEIGATGGAQKWKPFSCEISGASGKKDLCLVFTGGDGSLFNLDCWKFE